MNTLGRRAFLQTALGGAAALAAPLPEPLPMGINTYCLRALRWTDTQLIDYCAALKLDAIFLQDSLDPRAMDPAHWTEVRDMARRAGLHIETGGGGILPKTLEGFDASVATMRRHIERARAIGSPVVRFVFAGDRASLPPLPLEKNMETAVRLLRAVRSQVMDAGLKISMEVHKDFQAWEFKQIIEEAGKEFAGIYLDTGNPVFVMEDPLTTVETLGPYALSVHLRDSVVYEHPGGIAVQWVPLGEGTVDFKRIMTRVRELCPPVHIYIKPITGRPPQVLPVYTRAHWAGYPKARAEEFAQFLALARTGRPYDRPMVVEDLQGRATPQHFLAAIQYQQREHVERSVKYGREQLNLGRRWRA